ncbi:hypothetical protein SAMN06295967_101281 [Belliella buryatensis]|uniref:Uncharacterized protein n=1 Tax=Belliella buryatensis TaxID=1500549 RepID=A0A239APM4_9BACT|nr:hypothetical protein SAMN06295967_101281 [Belliella buryatensis]
MFGTGTSGQKHIDIHYCIGLKPNVSIICPFRALILDSYFIVPHSSFILYTPSFIFIPPPSSFVLRLVSYILCLTSHISYLTSPQSFLQFQLFPQKLILHPVSRPIINHFHSFSPCFGNFFLTIGFGLAFFPSHDFVWKIFLEIYLQYT